MGVWRSAGGSRKIFAPRVPVLIKDGPNGEALFIELELTGVVEEDERLLLE
jgi:hypothetical protein